jgi:ATP-dependent Zn protease
LDRTRRDGDVAPMMLARNAYRRARSLLADNRECLDDLAANALERETLTREDLDEIFAAHELASTERWREQEETPATTSHPAAL